MNKALNIIPCNPDLQPYFKSLNLAWITKYFEVEEIDEKVLSNPEKYIYNDGGIILMALLGEIVVGTVALKRSGHDAFELTKMAVDEKYQGQKIGYFLALAAIDKAKELGAKELLLYSQTILAPAVNLYKKIGFKEVELEPGKYKRCNIKMKMIFYELHNI
ncbi:MAG: GNAT family N-acetyltransferase [Bacteroidota bacterium]|nr:GNAT family N-acetyltransferase [Bacteroidota bacterium]